MHGWEIHDDEMDVSSYQNQSHTYNRWMTCLWWWWWYMIKRKEKKEEGGWGQNEKKDKKTCKTATRQEVVSGEQTYNKLFTATSLAHSCTCVLHTLSLSPSHSTPREYFLTTSIQTRNLCNLSKLTIFNHFRKCHLLILL